MNIINKIKSFIKKHVYIRKIARKLNFYIKKMKYRIITRNTNIDENLIIFASFGGKSYCDSPKAIYNYLINDGKYNNYKFIWAFKDMQKHQFLEENRNTKVMDIKSKEFFKTLGKAKYWIFNYKIQDYIFPRENQVFVQCWHGTPLKRLGCDLEHFNNAMNSISEIRHRYHLEASKFSYFISPSKFATEKFISTWDLEKINKTDIIIEEGYPRNDFLSNYTDKDVHNIKRKLGIENINKKIILYAPTWRDNQHTKNVGYTYNLEVDFDDLRDRLGDDYIVLFRAHYFVANAFDFDKYSGFVYNVSHYDDINDLYVISDLLITDYSSVFFDYAILKRPMIFYMYDLDFYKEETRGFYISLDELPGNIVTKQEDLINEIRKEFIYDDRYKKFNEKFNSLEDGHASLRVIEKCFK